MIKNKGLDPYGGLLQLFLLEDQPAPLEEKKPVGAPPVLDGPDLLRLIVDVAVHRRGGHVLPGEAPPPGSPFEWAERSGRYPGLSARQLHDAYHYAPKRRGFRDKVAAFFGKGE